MNLEELLDTMQDEMHSAHEEIEKFMGGNKSAGTRARKSMQTIKAVSYTHLTLPTILLV